MTVKIPRQTVTRLRATLDDLALRWEEQAASLLEGPPAGLFGAFTETQLVQAERAHALRVAARDLRETLRTGRLPRDLATDAELEQHAASEEAAR